MNLYVDDVRDCPEDFILAKSYTEAIEILSDNKVETLSLDHDLGLDSAGKIAKSGYDIVKYICENGIKIKRVYLHTDNPVGRENMYQTLIGAQRRGFISSDILIYRYPFVENKYSKGE